MEDIKTKVGYIRGLADGLGLDDSTREGKILIHIIELLDQVTDSLEELQTNYDELFEYAESIDEDLTDMETDFYDDDDEDDDDDDDDEEGFTIECPNCREAVYIDDDILDDEEDLEVLCPSCGEVVLVSDEDLLEDEEDVELDDYLEDEKDKE